jgi:hypothetical protein
VKINRIAVLYAALVAGLFSLPARSQTTQAPNLAPDETSITGTVVSYTRTTLVVRTENGMYQLFTFDRDAVRPQALPVGATVRVISTPSDEAGVRIANTVVAPAPSASTTAQAKPPAASEPVPASVRRLEDQIERQTRRYGAGVRGGIALDPELILVGVHARFGPFFSRNLQFRPNVEFGFGEVTKLFALNLEGIYRLPFVPRNGRWQPYVGAGPSLLFKHQNFERAEAGEGIDFGDFDFEGGLNLLTGIEFRSGVFFEAKATVYASPHFRLIVGYTF